MGNFQEVVRGNINTVVRGKISMKWLLEIVFHDVKKTVHDVENVEANENGPQRESDEM